MKKVLLLCGALLAITASAAGAAGSLHLGYDDCGGATDLAWACNLNSNTVAALSVITSFTSPGSVKLVGEEGVLDVSFGVPVPAWWRVGSTSTCGRTSASFVVSYIAPGAVCYDYFGSFINPPTGANTYEIGPLPGDVVNGPIDAARLRIRTVSAIDGTDPAALIQPAAGAEVFAFAATWTRRATTTCAGCVLPACLLFRHLKVTQPAGLGDFDWGLPDNYAYVTWQGGVGNDCPGATPATRSSWGQVKSLYR